ncbi:MAG: TlpA disulfide reductase family protein [Candidatus Hydrothermales bacterium]
MMKKVISLIFLWTLACGGNTPKKAPSFTLETIDGSVFNLSEHLGKKVILINFWATWCPPCRAEVPGFIRLYDKYKDQGLLIVGISLDLGENALERVKSFSRDHNINYPIMMGNREVVKKFGDIRAIPTTFIINKRGEIVEKIVGYRDEVFFENKIRSLL